MFTPLQALLPFPSFRAIPCLQDLAAENLGFFDAPDRDQWQKPDLIMDDLSIADGSVVADLGAAPGWWAVRLAPRVGPNGMIYAEDIQPQMIEVIRRRVQNERLQNVIPILGTPTDPRLPNGIDAALIVDTYPEIDDPVTLLENVAAVLGSQWPHRDRRLQSREPAARVRIVRRSGWLQRK